MAASDKSGYSAFHIARHLPENLSFGFGWKLAPVRISPESYEIALDNDCILWKIPTALQQWLRNKTGACLIAEDRRPCFGHFEDLCGSEPRNAGIRGLPPQLDYESSLKNVLLQQPVIMDNDLDEQGLQVAAVSAVQPPQVIVIDEVTICSPFPPLLPHLGQCGAHFVGLNERKFTWKYYDRPAEECVREHWIKSKPLINKYIFG